MPLPEVENILKKYKEEEERVERLLEENGKKEEEVATDDGDKLKKFPSYEEAKERNKTILKDLEIVKGNLRSKAIFSPTEMQWEVLCQRYQTEPALVATTWRCNNPVFV